MYYTVHPAALPSPKFSLAIPVMSTPGADVEGKGGSHWLNLQRGRFPLLPKLSDQSHPKRCYHVELVERGAVGWTHPGNHHELFCSHSPQAASGFCKNSARSLVAFYHNGAVPCECHPAGTAGHRCSPEGGQCPCRPNVIGRQCTRCATGHYGFPHCKRK